MLLTRSQIEFIVPGNTAENTREIKKQQIAKWEISMCVTKIEKLEKSKKLEKRRRKKIGK